MSSYVIRKRSSVGFGSLFLGRIYPAKYGKRCYKIGNSTHFCHFLATAPETGCTLAGSNPFAMGPNKNGPLSRTVSNSVVGDEGCPRAAGAARFRFVAPLLACCAGKRFAFPQLRTLSGSNPSAMGAKRKASITGGLTNQWWAMRDSNPQPCACKAPALTVAPIARAERV